MQFDYSVVVPVYNSQNSIRPLFDRTSRLFKKLDKTFQMILIDDESRDDSWNRIVQLKKEFPELIKAIKLAQNCGQQKATLCGIHHHNGRFIVTIDDDLQIPPEEIEKLIIQQRESNADLIYGLFVAKRHSPVRNIGSWFVNRFFRAFASTSGKGSSFRLIKNTLAQKLMDTNQKYLLLDEVLSWYTKSIAYQQVEHLNRLEGSSGYTFFKLVGITLSYIIYYTVIPLRLMTYIGFIFSLITFIIGVFYIYNRLVREVELGFTSLIVAIFFSTSLILFSIGIMGEYISRIYVKEWAKPPYIIEEVQ